MTTPNFCQNCGTAWLNSPFYKKCCSCGWKLSEEPYRDPSDDSDSDDLQVLSNCEQWMKAAMKKIEPGDKATFAANINQRQGRQDGFGHDPRDEPAFFQWREIEICLMEEGVPMYRLLNSAQYKEIHLADSLPDINMFVREHVRGYNKWSSRTNKSLVEDHSINAYIACRVGNNTPFEVPFESSATTTWGDFLKEFDDAIKAKKDKSKLVLAFPIRTLRPRALPKRSTPRPNNKRSKRRLRGSDEESGGEEGLLVKRTLWGGP